MTIFKYRTQKNPLLCFGSRGTSDFNAVKAYAVAVSAFFMFLFITINNVTAQTTLVVGDIAFTGYNSDNTVPALDTFSVVIARVGGISSNTVIKFTDNGWNPAGALSSAEGTITWTCGGDIAQGTQVKFSSNGNAYINNVLNGTCSASGAFSLSATGDQVLAYQGLSTAPTFIAGIHMNVCTAAGDLYDSDAATWDGTASATSNRSAKPPGLSTGTTAIWFSTEVDNARYKCTTLSGTTSAIATAVNTTTNWNVDDINFYTLPCVSAALSNNADLSAMTLSSGTLSPTFASATTTYTVSVTNAATSITVTPTVSQANATIQVQVNGGGYATVASAAASSSLALGVGSNTIDVKVTAQDGTTVKTYTTTVTRAGSSNADLSAMTISSGTLSPAFASATTTYTASVANATTSITVTPTSSQANAIIQVQVNSGGYATVASAAASSSLALSVGSNTIDVKVTAQDGTTIKTYTTTVTRTGSSNADLSAMTISSGTLSPTFASVTTSYTASVTNSNTEITVTSTVSQTNAVIQVRVNSGSYSTVPSGSVSPDLALNEGSNTIEVKVTAQDGTTSKTYSLTVMRTPHNALNFDGTNDYVVSDLSASSLTAFTVEMYVNPSVSQTTKGLFQWANSLNAATPMVLFQQNGTALSGYVNAGYYLTATLPTATWSHVALVYNGTVYTLYLNGVPVSTHTGGNPFKTNGQKLFFGNGYNGYWNGSIDEARVWNTARTAAQILAYKNRELYGNESGLISYFQFNHGIAGGVNTGVITNVDASSGGNSGTLSNMALTGSASNWIAGTVTTNASLLSANADLSNLTTIAGTISPTFASATTAYTASVSNTTSSLTVTPTVADATASIQVQVNSGGYATVTSNSASSALALNVGSNTIDVRVTAQDGTVLKTYTITVSRAKADQSITFSAFTAKTYGNAAFVLSATGGGSGNAVSYTSSNTAVATISGTAVTIIAAGTSTITASQAGNSSYNAAPDVQQTLTINAADLTITASTANKAYGTALTGAAGSTAFTSSGLANSEVIGSVTVAYGSGSAATAAVGTYTGSVTPSAATGGTFTAANYNITYATGDIVVGAKALTITATTANKTYGAAISGAAGSTNFTSSGLANSETISSVTIAYGSGSAATAAAGTYTGSVTPSAATGGTFTAANYNISYATGDIVVGTKALTITASTANKTYGTAISGAAGSTSFTSSGLANSETIGSVTIAYGTGSAATAAAGTYTGTVTPSAATGGTFTPANYAITYSTGDIVVGTKALTITASTANKTYGTAISGAAGSTAFNSSGLANLETIGSVTVAYSSGSAATAAVGTYTGSVTPSAATGGTFIATNYNISYAAGDIVVGAKSVTVAADAKIKTYGDADPSLTYVVTGALVGSDTFTGSLARALGENVGSYAITQGTLALSSNYALTYAGANLTIGLKGITVTAAAKAKTYGDVDPTLTYTSAPALAGTDAFTGSLARTAGESVGAYAITQGTLALSGNYTLIYSGANLSVGAKSIAVLATAKSKTYGDADPTLTYTSSPALVGTDAFTGTLTRATGNDVGNYAITQGTLALSSNYALTYTGANLTIGVKGITVTAAAKSKTYGEVDPALTYNFSPSLVGSDAFTGSLTRSTGENVGVYAITQGTLTLSTNYAVTYTSENLTIGTKAITVAAAPKSKTYGDTDPALTYTVTGTLVGSDAFTGTLARVIGENVGTYAINQGRLTLSGNYSISYTSADLTVITKGITVTAAARSKSFGDADPVLTYTSSPALVGSDAFNGSLTRASGENVGTYVINQGTLALSSNYELIYSAANLSIGAKSIAVSATAKSKIYGDAEPAMTYTFSPALIGTDSFTGSLTRAVGENVGNYAITQGTLALSSNYAVTYIGANLTIGTKAITATAVAKSKTYGDADPALTYTFTPALVTGDSFTGSLSRAAGENVGNYAITQGTLALSNNYSVTYTGANLTIGTKAITATAIAKSKTYGDADPALTYTFTPALVTGDSFTGSLSRASGENVGNYAITQGTLALSSNYVVTYTGANLTIGTKAITVTAVAKSKTYGDADPALTYTLTPALVTGDSFTGSLSRAVGENVGNYAITQGTLALSSNYAVTYTGANLTIDTKPITATAVAKSKTYGDADPALNYTFTPALVTGDSFTGSLSRAAGENVGNYAITQGTLALSSNYVLTYSTGTLLISKASLSVKADNKSRLQNTNNPAFTFSYAGFVNGEGSTVLSSQPIGATTANLTSLPGNFPITVSGGGAANYNFNYVNGILTVIPGLPTSVSLAPQTVYENTAAGAVAGTLSSTSDDPGAAFTYSLVSGTGAADNSLFTILGNQLRTSAPLNFEQKVNYAVRVRSTTQHNLSLDKELIITIGDVNEQPTLNDMINQIICYTPAGQTVPITGISAGPDAGQTTVTSFSSTNNTMFESLEISQANAGGNSTLSYKLKSGVSGSAVINVMVMDNGGTANSGINTIMKSFILQVNPLTPLSITSEKGSTLSKGEVTVLKAEVPTTAGLTFNWIGSGGILSGQNSQNLTVRPSETTTYKVMVTNTNGCISEQSITININADFEMVSGTNIMTPNGDGVNDRLVIKNIDMYPTNEVKIFDRAGRLIYAQKNYTDQWDGTLNGAQLAEDTYYYVVDFGAQRPKIKGFISIVKDK